MRLPVLDHGYIELLDSMGDEREIARAARISYGGDDEERTWEQDAKLIAYLHRNHHTSPFEMVELKWRVKAPIFVARQWLRHRTANVNEFSMRYAEPSEISETDEIEFYTPTEWREQGGKNKQGSSYTILGGEEERWAHNLYRDSIEASAGDYHDLIRYGVARELARIVLPVSVYTEFVWKNDLHNTLNFLKLRSDEHAQMEIREYSNAMVTILKQQFPRLMEIIWS